MDVYMQLVDMMEPVVWQQSMSTNQIWISGFQLPPWEPVDPLWVLLFWTISSTLYEYQDDIETDT